MYNQLTMKQVTLVKGGVVFFEDHALPSLYYYFLKLNLKGS